MGSRAKGIGLREPGLIDFGGEASGTCSGG